MDKETKDQLLQALAALTEAIQKDDCHGFVYAIERKDYHTQIMGGSIISQAGLIQNLEAKNRLAMLSQPKKED